MLRDHPPDDQAFLSREPAMHTVGQRMTPAQLAALVDAALRSPHSLSILDSAAATFNMIGRHEDGAAVA